MSSNSTNDPVFNFMRQAVQTKYGKNIDQNFLVQETTKIYGEFADSLLAHFKQMISVKQKVELDRIINETKNQDAILGFLMEKIENFEQKITQYLIEYKNTYISEGKIVK